MSGMLFLLSVQSLVKFGAKEGNERAIKGRKIILTCPLKDVIKLNRNLRVTNEDKIVVGSI